MEENKYFIYCPQMQGYGGAFGQCVNGCLIFTDYTKRKGLLKNRGGIFI